MDLRGAGPVRQGRRAAAGGGPRAKLGSTTAEDLLFHLPLRYEDRRSFARIADLRPGMKVSRVGHVAVAGLRRARRMTLYEIRLDDGSGRLKALWFNQPYLKDVLPRGTRVVLYGAVERDALRPRQLVMTSPQYEVVEADEDRRRPHGPHRPVYEKLGPLAGKALRRVLIHLAEQVPDDLADPLPARGARAPGRHRARRGAARRPPPRATRTSTSLNRFRSPAHLRLILEEFFLFQLGLAAPPRGLRAERKGLAFEITDRTREAVKRILPFPLTGAQKRVLREIADDMRSPHPMNRLVQGDVGSGKTMVALLSMVVALENGHQAAFMAPTEILAEQHYLTFRRLLARCPLPRRAAHRRRSRARSAKRRAARASPRGRRRSRWAPTRSSRKASRFHRLGLAVVDEQHRFGVLQRDDLRRKGYDVDVLVMTATPIPRTLALTAYGDLDVSVVDEKPPGRTPIRTLRAAGLRPPRGPRAGAARGRGGPAGLRRLPAGRGVREARGRAGGHRDGARSGRARCPGVAVGLLHGRMKGAEKEAVMARLRRAARSRCSWPPP